jgi:hypothetical protein
VTRDSKELNEPESVQAHGGRHDQDEGEVVEALKEMMKDIMLQRKPAHPTGFPIFGPPLNFCLNVKQPIRSCSHAF